MAKKGGPDYPYEYYDKTYYQRLAGDADRQVASARWRMRWLDELLDVQSDDRVVDLGSGAGSVAKHMAQRGAFVEGVDLAEEAVAFAQERCRDIPNVNFTACDATDCAHLASASFDKASCCDLIEHVHDDVMLGVFREARRLLKPGGPLFVYSPNVRHWIEVLKAHNFILKQPVGHIRVHTIKEVTDALAACGFELVRVAGPTSMLPVVRLFEWVWLHQPLLRELAVYRVCVLARVRADS